MASLAHALLAFLLGSWMLLVSGGLPEETVRTAVEFFAKRGSEEIKRAAADEAAVQVGHLGEVIPPAQRELQEAIDSALAQAQKARDMEKRSQAALVARMVQDIDDARSAAIPEVAKAVKVFAQRRALIDTAAAEGPALKNTLEEERIVEDERRGASITIQAAQVASREMQELAHEAHDVADHLKGAHALVHAQAANERNRLAAAQARQSLRIVRMSAETMNQSIALANSALERAKEAEKQAQQAVANARANALSLQLLKKRAQQAFQRSIGAALAQQHTKRHV